MEDMSWSVRDEKLQVNWTLFPRFHLSEYLLEWVKIPPAVHQSDLQAGWQRVPKDVTNATLNGTSSPFLKR